ncbi:5-formyltetrahydrofolate cyclo-ligase [Pseudoflavonifractor sp. MSJ-37]|uniref:5-formyltetrahydrofolate cyclo-ligase n=1 Tax=Pseudoflavonifractor sp. MSJ-37 TaxID=2841531 RepID=UPI001C0F7616|nr:5-formyltetrahydrofolate cyclo-ligase [Pseudoflavonifractor sp. MSJ-37]MBU5435644.1 5-formyltetrahydrofolate cyclo-ligase [Pseudoflavonifractor sp. MSJ-37]
MPSTAITEVKAALRRDIRARMKALTPEERQTSDRALFAKLLERPELEAAHTIFVYYGMGAELDTSRLLPSLTAMGKRVVLPRCAEEPGIMDARVYDPDAPLIRHRYGMLEPGPDRPVAGPEEIDLILVPGLAFDKSCYRLGQGGGYYDRYLPRCHAVTIALCRDCFLLESVPREAHDRPVDLVITESGTYAPDRP